MDTKTDHTMDRKQFLSVVGTMALGMFLLKFFDSKKVLSTVLANKTANSSHGYGNSAYGGKSV